MGKITLVLGGARSGKSSYALKLVGRSARDKVAFVATCEALDDEMKRRIALHRKSRPRHWKTFLAAEKISPILTRIGNDFNWIVIDCLTLFTSNMMLKRRPERRIEEEAVKAVRLLKRKRANSVIVSNEVGLGIVPDTKLGRDFRDIAGRVNQAVAREADSLFFMVSGIPWRIK
jgi:adenosylcobinamide kinase/adenosylcobinamide-phosphate guanylyltransferase